MCYEAGSHFSTTVKKLYANFVKEVNNISNDVSLGAMILWLGLPGPGSLLSTYAAAASPKTPIATTHVSTTPGIGFFELFLSVLLEFLKLGYRQFEYR